MTRTRMTTRLPDNLAEQLAARAAANHRSANAELVAILSAALSGTPETPTSRNKEKRARYMLQYGAAQADMIKADVTYEDAQKLVSAYRKNYPMLLGVDFAEIERRAAALMAPMPEPSLIPYKAAIRRLIDDSEFMRQEYSDMDEAVKQAEALL